MTNKSISFQELINVSIKFRIAVESYVNNKPYKHLSKFPKGCCKTTSFLLARYLFENGFNKPQYVWGEIPQDKFLQESKIPCIRLMSIDKELSRRHFKTISSTSKRNEYTNNSLRGTHGWLQLGGVIIDITADQFGAENPSVIVTSNNSFYLQFRPYRFFEYDSYMQFNKSYKLEHDEMYNSIVSLIQ